MNKRKALCRWCEENTDLIRAHIIPRNFYNAVKDDTKVAILLRPQQSKYTEVSQSGIFDPGILCAKCDNLLGDLDNYGFQVFEKRPTDANLVFDQDGMPVGYDLHCDDVQKAQKFILSMLWRASITTHDFFDAVSLGAVNEDAIRGLIVAGTNVTEEAFEFILIHQFDHPYIGGMMPPTTSRIDGILIYNFYLPFFKIIIRMDKRRLGFPFTVGHFRDKASPQCLRMPYADSPESAYMRGLAVALRAREQAED